MMSRLRGRSTADLLVLMIAGTICVCVLGGGTALIIAGFIGDIENPLAVSLITDTLAMLTSLLAGFLAGSTGALRNPYPTDLTPPKKPTKEPDEPA